MGAGERDETVLNLRQRLGELEARFAAEARKRGFDPAQAENMAMPATLAGLFTESEKIRSQLKELAERKRGEEISMPSEVERIQNQLQLAFAGEAWHGPSLLKLLADVDAAKAAARPIAGGHNIWELVLHIAAWDKAVTSRLGGNRGEVSDEENFPAIDDTSEASWQKAIETLRQNHRELMDAIGRADEHKLDQPIVEGMSSSYVHMHGAIQHDLYHAGQIAILKKA